MKAEKFRLDDRVLKEFGIGYVPDRRFNERFREQRLNCPYEHCIETMSLHEDEAIKAVKMGMIIDIRKHPAFCFMDKKRIRQLPEREPELYKEIREILDSQGTKDEECWFGPDLERYVSEFGHSQNSCRLYGHQCPGGKEQINECVSEGMFET